MCPVCRMTCTASTTWAPSQLFKVNVTMPAVVRVVGVDGWAWRKGTTFGTVIVDLERRHVVELLADRSAATTAGWLKKHPDIEVVSRDRAGLYADAAREGAPQARQIADRFHLLSLNAHGNGPTFAHES